MKGCEEKADKSSFESIEEMIKSVLNPRKI